MPGTTPTPTPAQQQVLDRIHAQRERLVKRLHRRAGRIALLAENPAYPPLEVREGMELLIWGVVTGRFARVPA